MCGTSAGYLTRISDILIRLPARLTDRWNHRRLADVKAFSLERIICPGAQRGHGSTLWCDSFTIWRNLCCLAVGIWCQLNQGDARRGHLEVSLMVLIRGSWSFVNEPQCAADATPAASIMSLMRDEAIPNAVFHHDAGLRAKLKQHIHL